jgi:hypothetical protein
MFMSRVSLWFGALVLLATVASAPARALTTMEAPVNTDGSQRFADPDERIQNNFSGEQNGQTPRGFSIQIRPSDRSSSDPSSPYYRPISPPGMFWAPGLQLPKN